MLCSYYRSSLLLQRREYPDWRCKGAYPVLVHPGTQDET